MALEKSLYDLWPFADLSRSFVYSQAVSTFEKHLIKFETTAKIQRNMDADR